MSESIVKRVEFEVTKSSDNDNLFKTSENLLEKSNELEQKTDVKGPKYRLLPLEKRFIYSGVFNKIK
jgi:hypothetical protein